ncbi:MAG: hypothetical protein HDR80_08235 [Bacteroides sp.]|nr:hypothetical protein [Bacteroides sp.]
MTKNKIQAPAPDKAVIEARRKNAEAVATFGLLIVAVAMLCPFMSFLGSEPTYTIGNTGDSFNWTSLYKWIYAAGALLYTGGRLVGLNDKSESLRLRRLRRLEFWAGMAFCVGAFFWFYNESKFSGMPYVGPLAVLRDTVLFSLVGATIQVIASWLIYFRQKKEAKAGGERPSGDNP